jgi:hypothetical protein
VSGDANRGERYHQGVKKIRYRDLDLPDGLCVADGKGIRLWDENTARELALTGMLLSQGAKRAKAMLDAAETPEIAIGHK